MIRKTCQDAVSGGVTLGRSVGVFAEMSTLTPKSENYNARHAAPVHAMHTAETAPIHAPKDHRGEPEKDLISAIAIAKQQKNNTDV